MLERTTRSYFEDVIAEDFNYLQSNIVNSEKKQSSRTIRKRNSKPNQKRNDFLVEEHTMTRKTRTRRPRISALQSGYCAVCNIPYNSVEDHIQSKKHQKLIGEDANYIALNGSLNGFLQNSSIPFLNLNGIDAIGVHDTSLDEFSPTYKKRVMRRTRAVSVIFDRTMNPPPLSPADSDITGHHLRSRRNINYMTPPLEDDSLQEKPDLTVEEIEQENKDARELRLITRSLKKIETPQEEVWNSGRPKRACISKKRLSVDDRLANFKTYYKVEVVTPKLKINASKHQEATKRHKSQSPKREEEKDKGLIVKFKKLRNSELVQLNNEATNFLFPKKDDSSDEEEDDCNTTASSADSSSILELEDCKSSTPRLKNEDETSMDSTGKKKKRRTHAEAFILDNQKYYKFETPGSSHCRLRYQGSYLPMVIKSPEHPPKIEDNIKFEEPKEKKIKCDAKVKLDNYKFAFEKVPINTGWYNAFKRLDNAEQSYPVFSNYFWESFVLPYQMRTIQPLDKKLCYNHYQELLTCLLNASSEANSRCSSPEASCSNSSVSMYDPQDEDSKLSASTISSIDDEEGKTQNGKTIQSVTITRCGRKSKAPFRGSRSASLSPNGSRGGKNPRKSPRQHASTLAILSGLIEQRKRRSKGRILGENIQNLSAIDEDELLEKIEEEVLLEPPPPTPTPPPPPPPPPPPIITALRSPPASKQVSKQSPMKTKSPLKRGRPRIDYYNIARQIDEELDTALDADLENYELEITDDNTIDFNSSRITLTDILGLYEENNSKETEKSCRRFFNGQPGRKLGYRKKKANKTGWPKNKRPTTKKETNIKEKEGDVDSTIDTSVNNDTEEDEDEEDEEEHPNPKSMKKDERPKQNTSVNNDSEKDEPEEEKQSGAKIIKKEERPKRNIVKQKQENNKNDKHSNSASLKYRVNKSDKKQLLSQLTNGELLQPYVCVQKLDSKKLGKKFIVTQKRTTKRQRQRRMPGSPKSPRMLRKPRGRWYRER